MGYQEKKVKQRDENAPITDKTDIKILILTFMSELNYPLDSATMPEFFGKRFGSHSLKLGASVIIFIFLIIQTSKERG